MTVNYNRSDVVNYYELSDEQKQQVCKEYDYIADGSDEDLVEEYFVIYSPVNGREDEILPLSMFMRSDRKFTHFIYSLSAFSGYFVTISKNGDSAVIAYKTF